MTATHWTIWLARAVHEVCLDMAKHGVDLRIALRRANNRLERFWWKNRGRLVRVPAPKKGKAVAL